MTGLIEQGVRAGARMLILNIWHPDILGSSARREAQDLQRQHLRGHHRPVHASRGGDLDWDLVFPTPPTSHAERGTGTGSLADHGWRGGDPQDGQGPRDLERHHRKRLGIRRTGNLVRGPMQQGSQFVVLSRRPTGLHQPLWRTAPAGLGGVQPGTREPVANGPQGRSRLGHPGTNGTLRGTVPGQRDRCHALLLRAECSPTEG